ncbi:MAG: T9SS type A sorting domain-containing protein, partial [Ignavibacteriota bacterium]
YWTVTQSGISSFSCDVTAQYLPADVVGTESSIYAGKYSSGVWIGLGQADAVNHRITGTVNGFSTFTGAENGVLPVSLSSFTSSVNVRDVKLNWVTSSEMNNSGFEIERAGIRQEATRNWEKMGFVTGKGTTNTPTNYSFTDSKLATGKYKYRLKQIDNNGNFEYHNLSGEVEVGVPTKYEMSQNYPNPFNPMTKIDFQLPMDGKVSLKIFDITGREMATLLNNEFKKADYYTVMFNGSNLSSGVYFYRITADKYVMTKKMVLVK